MTKMINAANRTIRVACALIEDGEKLLFVRKKNTPWFMQAGGKIEPGETPLQALERELAEEIGYVSDPHNLPTFIDTFSAPAVNETGWTVVGEAFHVHLAKPDAAALQASAEIAEAVWVTPQEAAALPLAPLSVSWLVPLAERLYLRPQTTPETRATS